jgi:hypothetical protein
MRRMGVQVTTGESTPKDGAQADANEIDNPGGTSLLAGKLYVGPMDAVEFFSE